MNQQTYEMLPIGSIAESPLNPRKAFADLEELAADIKRRGVLQPVKARPVPKPNGITHELVFGARRFRAAKLAGLEEIPALVREMTDEEVLEEQLVENAKRADVHPLEEARGYHELAHRFGRDVSRIAEQVGHTVSYVYDRMKLLQLTKVAQQLFLAGDFSLGHAIILARLSPDDQERAMDQDSGGLWSIERPLFAPGDERDSAHKPNTARELQAWVDQHVKFKADEADPMLFPDTVATVKAAQEEAEKVVPITHEHFVRPDARDGDRVWGPQSWKRADGGRGAKKCDRAVTGVIVVGPGRGEAFKVCVDKKRCTVHWAAEQKRSKQRAAAVAKGTSGEDSYQRQQEKRELQRKEQEAARARWKKAKPAIIEAIEAAVEGMDAGFGGKLAELLIDYVTTHNTPRKNTAGRGRTAEDLVRHLARIALVTGASDDWRAYEDFPKVAKNVLGLDVNEILDNVAPKPPEAKEEPKAKASTTKRAKAKARK